MESKNYKERVRYCAGLFLFAPVPHNVGREQKHPCSVFLRIFKCCFQDDLPLPLPGGKTLLSWHFAKL